MAFSQTILLLPCHSLEDFPTHNEGDEAEGLLSAWCCGWHPRILAASGAIPQWTRADDPPTDLADKLLIIPSLGKAELPTGFVKKARDAGATVVTQAPFPDMVSAALAGLAEPAGENAVEENVPEETVEDFFALAYVYLQIELLTRQMRYACNLDEAAFADEVVAAARFAIDGDRESSLEKLTRGFDLISEERDHYYSVEAYLLDITLVAPTTIGDALRRQLRSDVPTTLLLCGATLEAIQSQSPDLITEIRTAWDAGRISVAGGDYREDARFPLYSQEMILAELQHGLATFERLLGRRPTVYGRRTAGLTPVLPQILTKLGFTAAFHFSLDDGQVPQSGQAKLRWEGLDGTTIDVLGRPPQDANLPETYLSFAMKMGESMDMDFVATAPLAHWPGKTCRWFELMRRASRFGSAMGRFVTAEQYFEESAAVGQNDCFESDRYTTNYLRQDIIRNTNSVLSSVADAWCDELGRRNAQTFRVAADCLMGREQNGSEDAGQRLARQLSGPGEGVLVLNSLPVATRVTTTYDSLQSSPAAGGQVYARETESHGKRTVVDVPSVGFTWVKAGDGPTTTKEKTSFFGKKKELLIAEEGQLRNEFFEVLIHSKTGGIQGITPFGSRGNLVTQQLAMRVGERVRESGERWQDPDELAIYTEMEAESIEVVASSPVYGAIKSRGKLVSGGEVMLHFSQTVQVWRGSRFVRLEIELEHEGELRADPWKNYIASRLAWGDEGATVTRNLHEVQQKVESKRFASPLYVQVDNGLHSFTLLPLGLPYHRLVGLRMLDSLLKVRGEKRTSWQIVLGIDVPQPFFAACQNMLPAQIISGVAAPNPDHAWLFHLGARNVASTNWAPITEAESVVGVRCRLLETAGKACRAKIAGPRNITSARIVDFRGEPIADCPLQDGRAIVEMTPFEWSQVELRWSE
jgi:alpha-mannosidase